LVLKPRRRAPGSLVCVLPPSFLHAVCLALIFPYPSTLHSGCPSPSELTKTNGQLVSNLEVLHLSLPYCHVSREGLPTEAILDSPSNPLLLSASLSLSFFFPRQDSWDLQASNLCHLFLWAQLPLITGDTK
jgi:hypothetical protein